MAIKVNLTRELLSEALGIPATIPVLGAEYNPMNRSIEVILDCPTEIISTHGLVGEPVLKPLPTPLPKEQCICGHERSDHASGASSMCAKCKCAEYMPISATATEAKRRLDQVLAKPLPAFPFSHRDRYEVAYTLLVWELLKLATSQGIHVESVLDAMTRAAGELS